mgnify:CR=1 FL=1
MSINKLRKTIKKLRHPVDGCPWDKKQTHKSLMPYIIEEAYETVDAIQKGSKTAIREELGDLLLQIVLNSQIAEENNNFTLDDVINEINQKMIRRHPHVFKNKEKLKLKELNEQWDILKANEKDNKKNNTPFSYILKANPALLQALEITKEAKKLGFDWKNYEGPLKKMEEELEEIKEEINQDIINKENLEIEIGDLIFSIVNLCRHMKINPEVAVIKSNTKFIKRFKYMIKQFKNIKKFTDSSTLQKEIQWKNAKKLK